MRATVQDPAATPAQPPRTYLPGARSQQQRREHLPRPSVGMHDGRRLKNTHAPDASHRNEGGRVVDDAPEERKSWVDSKAFGISVWIVVPLIVFIVILSLVLGLRG